MLDRRDRRLWQKATGVTLCALGSLAALSCRREQTSILIVVNSDFAVTSELSEIRVRVTPSAPGASSNELTFTLAPAGDPRCGQRSSGVHCLPLSFAIEPNPSRPAGVPTRVELTGVHGSMPVVQRAAVLSFRTGNSLAYGMFLPRECAIVNNRCAGEGLTCTENGCAPERVPNDQLVGYTPGNEQSLARPPGDGGAFADSAMDGGERADAMDDGALTDATDAGPSSQSNYTLRIGNSHSCALHRRTGRVLCWGDNDLGQLARGFVTPPNDAGMGGLPTPEPVASPEGDAGVPFYTAIAVGRGTTCAVTATHELYCAGNPDILVLDRNRDPITRLRRVPGVEALGGSPLVDVFSSNGATFLQYANGQVSSFGNRYGSAAADGPDNGGEGPVRSPGSPAIPQLARARFIANAHDSTGVAIDPDGVVLGWGDPQHSVLGALTGARDGSYATVPVPTPIPAVPNAVRAFASSTAAMALTASGAVYVWGHNEGNFITTTPDPDAGADYATPVLRSDLPPNIRAIAVVSPSALALAEDGRLYCFGARYYGNCPDLGRIGSVQRIDTYLPNPAPTIVDVQGGWRHACVLTADDRVICWGNNSWSQCGGAAVETVPVTAPRAIQLPAL